MSNKERKRVTKESWIFSGTETVQTLKAPTREANRPKQLGTYYQATFPDTLDLAKHARYGINHMTSIISEDNNYEMYWGSSRAW